MNFSRTIAFGCALLLAGQALAWDETLNVPANRTTSIAQFSVGSSECYSIRPKMTVPKKPEHGEVTFKWVATRLGEKARLCRGKAGYAMEVLYTPHKGYRGKDVFKVAMGYPQFIGGTSMIYNIQNVKLEVQ
jgi:hypothetical protein